MNYYVDTTDQKNIKVRSSIDILQYVSIGLWVTPEPIGYNCRYLSKENGGWWETEDLGRYCNHSNAPNLDVTLTPDGLLLSSNQIISINEELFVNYNDVTEYTGYIPNTNFIKT